MTEIDKVVWHEGVFLTPQHFQQQERYFENICNNIVKTSHSHNYGIFDLSFDKSGFKQGLFKLRSAGVIFPNGFILNLDRRDIESLVFEVPANLKPTKLYICILDSKTSVNDITSDHNSSRYIASEHKVVNQNNVDDEAKNLLLARINPILLLEKNLTNSHISIPLATISTNDKKIIEIDQEFIPPNVCVQSNENLYGFITEICGLLSQKSSSLANAVNDPNKGGTIEVLDFIMLQTVNRYLAYMLHEQNGTRFTHPETLFVNLSKLCADLMTFLPARKVEDLPEYNHNDLTLSFKKLISKLRISLSQILEQRIMRIPLEQKDEATYVAQTPSKSILDKASFVLAVTADMPNEDLRQSVPETMKISTVEKIQELIGFHLSGIKLNALSVAPRELPYHNGYVYFELDKQNELWKLFDDSSAMAFHLAGDFPNVSFEFWAIKPNVQ